MCYALIYHETLLGDQVKILVSNWKQKGKIDRDGPYQIKIVTSIKIEGRVEDKERQADHDRNTQILEAVG